MQTLQSLFAKCWIFVVSLKKNIYVYKNHNIIIIFFSFALRYTFTFPCLVICWNLCNLFEI